MRDVERLREKIELTLDDRQVVALAVCALLLLGGVFSLGILLGKKLSTLQAPAAAPSDLASLDAQARIPGPAPAPARPTSHPETPAKPAASPSAEKVHELTVKPEQARLASIVAPPLRQTTVIPPPARAVPPPATPVPLTAPPRDLGEFTVQLGASQERTEAARLEARARGAGLKPYVVEANLGAKGTWYRVRVGAFKDREAASRFRTDVERELRSAAVVMTAH